MSNYVNSSFIRGNYCRVSVIVPCYCVEETLPKTIQSILEQTLLPLEIILIDDGSNDDGKTKLLINSTIQVIKKSHPKISVRGIYLHINQGPGHARNVAWKYVTQPWIAFLDADDIWHSKKLQIQVKWLENNPSAMVVCHKTSHLRNIDLFLCEGIIKHRVLKLHEMLISNLVPTRSVMIKSEIGIRFGEGNCVDDYQLWLEIIGNSIPIYKLNLVLAFSIRSEFSRGGISGKLLEHQIKEINTLKNICNRKNLSKYLFLILCIWSYIKFLKRIVQRSLILKYIFKNN